MNKAECLGQAYHQNNSYYLHKNKKKKVTIHHHDNIETSSPDLFQALGMRGTCSIVTFSETAGG